MKKLSRTTIATLSIVLLCGVFGGGFGWYAESAALRDFERSNPYKEKKPDAAFIIPFAPAEVVEQADIPLDPASLLIWELTARQPLAPRKEPLTPPSWKIVGVTAVGKEKNVLILFDNQPTAESRTVGDKLPGGAKIVDISQDQLRIILNGQRLKLNLREQ